MKKFNLEEYLKNPSKRVVTREWYPVRIVCTDMKGLYPIVGIVRDLYDANNENAISYTENGSHILNWESRRDLFFASEKHEGWINVYRNGEHLWCGDIKRTEAEAKEFEASEFYITSIKIEWEE